MDFAAIRSELDQDFSWRIEELKFFQNQAASLSDEQKSRFRRALVLILYSHFEGFCKFALLHYIRILNSTNMKCGEATHALAAASLAQVFHGLRDTQRRNPHYTARLPEDETLHRFAREKEFIEKLDNFINLPLAIPDSAIDTESNLKPDVLKKVLYRLGFDPMQFEDVYADIGKLVGLRNNIAHGATKAGVSEKTYAEYEKAAMRVMNKIVADVMDALRSKIYLK
jgi:hypothetical protein